VAGADIVSEFVVSGFQSFKSLSFGPCKPFDIGRDGLNLGEGAGTLMLTSDAGHVQDTQKICACGGASSNDSNHISGPSRTGEGLYIAVQKAMDATNTTAENLDYISAHGTATPYNDEMEAKAFTLAGIENVPVNSYKGYFGHTLGAAGVIETALSVHSMRANVLFNTLGFNELGVPDVINVIKGLKNRTVNKVLKTASGFGGCNAALVLCKTE
jgi:3-oxoacyl-[acyl-carrier-protein] synthase-1